MRVNIHPSKCSIGLKILYSMNKMSTIARLGTKLLKLHLLDISNDWPYWVSLMCVLLGPASLSLYPANLCETKP